MREIEVIMLSEVSQKKRDRQNDVFSYVEHKDTMQSKYKAKWEN